VAHTASSDLLRYHRRIDTLTDIKGQNNCTASHAMGSECIPENHPVGWALMGLVDPLKRTLPTAIRVSDGGKEPPPPVVLPLDVTVTVMGPLVVGKSYTIFRFDGVSNYPKDSQFESGPFTSKHVFEATGQRYEWQDPAKVLSSGATYYTTVANE